MTAKLKVFISFSTEDRLTAYALYKDLSKAGAEVFQFEETATPGMPAWDEVLENIEAADIFLLLASKSALKSRPVQEEIKFAYYQYVNEGHPNKLIPLMLEREIRLPPEMRTFNQMSFESYQNGLERLIKLLQLGPPAQPATEERNKTAEPTAKPVTRKPKNPTTRVSDSGAKPLPTKERTEPPKRPVPQSRPLEIASRTWPGLGEYAMVIGIIALLGAAGGWIANSFVVSLDFAPITGTVRAWSEHWTWLSLASRIVLSILLFIVSWIITFDEIPLDVFEYALVSAKSVGIALVVALIWSFLFSQVTGGSATFVLISVGVAAGAVLTCAVIDEI